MRRRQRKDNKQAEKGRMWAEYHFLQPGRPQPIKTGNKDHDRACAERWNELAGVFPGWWTWIAHRDDGFWIINADGAACDCGPYYNREDALSDAMGMENFAKYEQKPGYVTSEKKPRHKQTSEAAKRGQKRVNERNPRSRKKKP